MELAAIITTVFVVILQIITIALVVGTRKIVRDQVGKTNPALSNEKLGEKRERDFRIQNKRPVQEQRPKPPTHQPTNTGSVDTVEKSLRDINLKLKNAERDQEFARRRVQENFPKESNSNRRPGGNDRPSGSERSSGNDRNNRGDRGGRDNRDHRHGNDRNRDRRGGNWQDRNKSREPMNFASPQNEEVQITENQNLILNQEQLQSQEPITQTQVAQTPIISGVINETSSELIPADFNSEDNLQHGRKIMVKRRMLKEDGSLQSEGNDESNSSENSSAGVVSETSVHSESNDVEKAPEGEIRFGRR